MKEGLRKALENYARIINETPKDFDDRTQEDWDREGDAILEQARIRETDHFIEDELFSMQKQKMERMDELRQTLRDIDAGRDIPAPEGAFPVGYSDGMYRVAISDDPADVKFITAGDIMIAPLWGTEYHLDPATVPRWVQKRYALERAKASLGYMRDAQIMHDELNGYESDDRLQQIYGLRFANHLGRLPEKAGIVMERVVQSVLKRLSIDCPLDFVVKDADIHDDVQLMTDFYVQKKGDSKPYAVQFTTSQRKDSRKWKRRRARELSESRTDVEDIIVISLDLGEPVETALSRWLAEAPKALTPADAIPAEVQERICFFLVRRMYPPEEGRAVMQKIHNYLGIVRD